MRILIIQENGHHDKNRNFRECFSLKRAFESYNSDVDIWGKLHSNYYSMPDWELYDLIFCIEKWDWMPDLSKVQTKKFMWAIDGHCSGPEAYNKLADKNNFDKVFHSTPEFAQSNCWLPNCYDDTLIKPLNIIKEYDIGFCGNTLNRSQFINMLSSKFKDRFKHHEMVIGGDMVNAINSYKVHWNKNISIDINYRNFETMGCKTCLLTSNNPNYSSLGFRSGQNCFIYNNLNQMLELAEYLICNDNIIDTVSKEGFNLVKDRHTYKHRAETIYDSI